jgi:Uma2 family endonuclease
MYNSDDDDEVSKVEEAALKYLHRMTPEQFLEWEDKQEIRYEYVDGEIFPVEAATMNHGRITANIIGETHQYLKGKSCQIVSESLVISAKSMKSYFHPDATIFCEDPEKVNIAGEAYKNPTVIIEVLSPSTHSYDMGKKMFFYMQIDSLKEYIIIDSRKVEVQIARRQPDNSWKFEMLNASNEVLLIESIGMSIKLAEIYNGITFGTT